MINSDWDCGRREVEGLGRGGSRSFREQRGGGKETSGSLQASHATELGLNLGPATLLCDLARVTSPL